MELFTTTGFTKGNYGQWLNVCMEAAPCEWVLIHDHDTFLNTNPRWFDLICENIEKAENPGLLTCVTNRIGNPEQKVSGLIPDNHDLHYHYAVSLRLEKKESPVLATRPISGLMMVTSKTAWRKAGGFKPQKPIGLDNNYHRRILDAGYKVYIMRNVYVYHKYRAWEGQIVR